MDDARRERLRRAAINRRQIRQWSGRRVNEIDDATIAELSKMEHVESIQPVIVERYQIKVAEFETPASLSYGVDVSRRRYSDRIIAGNYFSGEDADEVILHEYMLYKWGLLTGQDYERVIGKTITLRTIINENEDAIAAAPEQLKQFSEGMTDEEREAFKVLLPRLMQAMGQVQSERKAVSREFTVVGVMREAEPGDVFNVIEDGNAVQADVFLPQPAAKSLFLESVINRELGYPRAIVLADNPENAPELEQKLRDKGYTAFSVASVLEQVETMLTVITVIIGFLTGIALIVSTLGIVNTMITSVLERTREIGIFKAVGATNSQVMAVFLTESAIIGLVGGLLGLGIAMLAMIPGDIIAAGMIAERAAVPYTGSVFIMPVWLAIAGPALGAGTAVLAAIAPARRAARIDPVKALRHD
jgi:putative ABC transport system permease protein